MEGEAKYIVVCNVVSVVLQLRVLRVFIEPQHKTVVQWCVLAL